VQLLKLCKIPDESSPECKMIDCDGIFAATNEEEETLAEQRALGAFNNNNTLLRFEFMQCLVRLAIAKYVNGSTKRRATTKAIKDVSDALDYLLTNNIAAHVPVEATHDPDTFRRKRLYRRAVHELCERNEVLLQTVFEFYAAGWAGKADDPSSERSLLLSVDEWLQLVTDCDLYDDHFRKEQAVLAFKWAQMHCTDEVRRAEQLLHLTYVDFLEALARICCFKRLPTPEDLKANQSRSVGHFYQQAEADASLLDGLDEPLDWQEEEGSSEPLRLPLETLQSLVLERLAQSEAMLTRKELRVRLVAKQRKREKMRAAQAQQRSGSPQSPRGMLSNMLSNPQSNALV